MHYVYMIQRIANGSIYVGNSNALERRLSEHNSGNVTATKSLMPLRLVYYEAYLREEDALNREHKLKHHGSVIGHLKKRLKNSLLA